MNRKYIGLGVVVLLVVTIILCIFLIPSATDDSGGKESQKQPISGVATTFAPLPTTPPPLVTPKCPTGTKSLHLLNARVEFKEMETALQTSCAGIESLELVNIEILGTGGNVVPLPRVTLPSLRRFTFDRSLIQYNYPGPSERRKYANALTPEILKNDFVFLNTKEGRDWTLPEVCSELGLDYMELKVNGAPLLVLDRANGIVRFQ